MATPETSNHPKKGCKLCCDDDNDPILVSVSPREFSPASARGGRTYMEIQNRNAFPISFRTSTSNSQRLSTYPQSGYIPPNSKATVVVNFHACAAVPSKHHEEVLVFTSPKPLDPSDIRSKETFRHGHYHKPQCLHHKDLHSVNGCTNECRFARDPYRERQRYLRSSGERLKSDWLDKRGSSSPDQVPIIVKDRNSCGRDYTKFKHPDSCCSDCYLNFLNLKRTVEDSEDKSKPMDHFQRRLHASGLKDNGGQDLRLEEVCLHAFVHRVYPRCRCNTCFGLASRQETQPKSVHETYEGVRAAGHERQEHRTQTADWNNKDPNTIKEADFSVGRKDPHVAVRVVNCEDTPSDTDVLSDGSCWWDGKRYMVVTEEMFEKGLKRAVRKVKRRQGREVESSSSATTCCKKEAGNGHVCCLGIVRRRRPLSNIEDKCSNLIKHSWIRLIISLLLLLVIVCIFVCGEITSKRQLSRLAVIFSSV